jgi:hypothetical protein
MNKLGQRIRRDGGDWEPNTPKESFELWKGLHNWENMSTLSEKQKLGIKQGKIAGVMTCAMIIFGLLYIFYQSFLVEEEEFGNGLDTSMHEVPK